MTENLTSNEITRAYAAKNLAPYLQVTAPPPPEEWKRITRAVAVNDKINEVIESLHSAYLFATDRKAYQEKKQSLALEERISRELCERRDAEDNEYFRSQGLITNQEKYAFMVVNVAGSFLVRAVYSADFLPNKPEVIARGRHAPVEIRITVDAFKNYLRNSVKEGLFCLEEKYWIGIKGVPKPEIINPEFENTAVNWLGGEVYSRILQGQKVGLLEQVKVKLDEQGMIRMGWWLDKKLE